MALSNELIFILIALADLSVIIGCWKYGGKAWLEMIIILNYVVCFFTLAKFTNIFGMSATIGAIFYAAIYLGTDIITEHFGKKAGQSLIKKAFGAIIFVNVAIQVMLLVTPDVNSLAVHESMLTVYQGSTRVVIASLFVFLIVQNWDIWVYHWIHEKTQGRMLWLRNLASTASAQMLDTFLFFGLAFYGVIANELLFDIAVSALIIKLMIAVIDTPFIYLSYWVKGIPLYKARDIPHN